MTVAIRPHHLLCLLTYLGKGYTPEFVRNYNEIVDRLNQGEDIRIVDGPDDICQPMLSEENCHCQNASVSERDAMAARQIRDTLGIELNAERTFVLTHQHVKTLRSAFADGLIRDGCPGCEWQSLCTKIADQGFTVCRLAGLQDRLDRPRR